MSDANGSETKAEVLSALIICQNPKEIRGSISFLNRRGVETAVAETIADALSRLSANKPRFVLISANFQHQKIESMPQILQSNFNVEVIVFSEKSDRKIDQRITNMKARNVIYGQVSGPSILLKLRQLIKESEVTEDKDSGPAKEKREIESAEGERIRIGGKNATKSDDQVVLSTRKGAAPDSLKRFMQDLGEDESQLLDPSLKKSGSTFVAKGKPPRKFTAVEENERELGKNGGVLKDDPRLEKSPFSASAKQAKEKTGRGFSQKNTDTKDPSEIESASKQTKFSEIEKSGAQNQHSDREQSAASQNKYAEVQRNGGVDASKNLGDQANSSNPGSGSAVETKNTSENKRAQIQTALNQNKYSEIEKSQGPLSPESKHSDLRDLNRVDAPPDTVGANERASQLWSCARLALLEVSHGRDVYDVRLEDLHSAYLLSLNSPSLQTSFILAVAKGRDFPYGAISDLHERFLFHLRAQGHSISDGHWELIELQSEFADKQVFAGSDFTLSAHSSLMAVSISFLDVKQTKPVIETGFQDFSKVAVCDIVTDVPLTFEAYIHLPLNNRTIKYLKNGSSFREPQRDRLSRDGAEHFFIREESVKNFREHHARGTLSKEIAKKRRKCA